MAGDDWQTDIELVDAAVGYRSQAVFACIYLVLCLWPSSVTSSPSLYTVYIYVYIYIYA